MGIKNFVTDFIAAVSPADSSPALDAWLTYAAANDGSTLIIPAGTYHWAGSNGPTNGLKNATISATGAIVDNLFIGRSGLIRQDFSHTARIQSANKGDTSVTIISAGNTLIGAANASLFTVGQYMMVSGLATQVPDSYPPNFHCFEYKKITAIVGATIFFADGLKNDYKSTWPYIDAFDVTINIATSTCTCPGSPVLEGRTIFFTTSGTLPTGLIAGVTYHCKNVSGQTFQVAATLGGSPISMSGSQTGTHSYHASNYDLGGPATIWAIDPSFEGVQTYTGLRCTAGPGGVSCGVGSSLIIDGMYFDGSGPSVSSGILARVRNTQFGSQNELDKCLEKAIYENCTAIGIKQILVQSSSINSLVINGTTMDTLNGTPRNTAIDNCTIGTLFAGALGFGASDATHVQNSTITTISNAGTQLDISSLVYSFGSGIFTVTNLNANANTGAAWASLIPGYKYFYAFYDGVVHNIDNLGNMVTFQVSDVTQDATNTYFHTDLVAQPVTTFAGHVPNRIICFAALQTSGPVALTNLQAPAPLPANRSLSVVFG